MVIPITAKIILSLEEFERYVGCLQMFCGADTGKTKLEAAEKNGVKVIDEAELDAMLGL